MSSSPPPSVHTPPSVVKPTPAATSRPLHPPAPGHRVRHNTLVERQEVTEELVASREIVTPTDIDVNVLIKRVGRLEDRFDVSDKRGKNTNFWSKWGVIGLGTLVVAWPKIEAWTVAHQDMGYGLVGLAGTIVGAFLVVLRARQATEQQGGSPPDAT